MRILALTHQYPLPGHEGFAPYNRQQFRALAASHELRLIAPVAWTRAAVCLARRLSLRPRVQDGIHVIHPVYYYPPRVMVGQYGEFYLRSVRRTFARALDEFRPDVVLSCWAHPDGWAAVQLGREAGLPVVIKVIGSDVLVLGRHRRRRSRIAQALSEADRVVAVSRDLAHHVIAMGVDAARVQVVPEGIDLALFSPGSRAAARRRLGLPPAPARVLFVGRFVRGKGVAVLIEASGRLRERGVEFQCDLVGDGRDDAKMRALISRYGLADLVALRGCCDHVRLADWYRACDVVALPSFSEGLPNVLREAISCGRPFVATNVGGIPEIAHPSYSRLVPPRDAVALADALEELLVSPPTVDPKLVADRNVSCEQSANLLADCLAGAVAGRAARDEAMTCETEPTLVSSRDIAL